MATRKKAAKTTKKAPARKPAGGGAKDQGKVSDFMAAVKGRSSSWKDARMGGADVPEGTYVAQVVSAGVGATKGIPWFRMGLVITRGEMKGATLSSFQRLAVADDPDNTIGMQILARDLGNLLPDYDMTEVDLVDLPQIATELGKEKPSCRIGVKKDGQYTNVSINGAVEE